jgi:regulatory protein
VTGPDDEKLAPVTYLFGEKPVVDERADSWAVLIADKDEPEPRSTPSSGPVFQALDDDDLDDDEEIPDPEAEADRAHNVALHALARRGVSVAEMRKLLLSRDLDENTVEVELERLLAVDLLNDGALADTLVRSLQERKGLGRSGVTAELRRRGIEQEAITLALETDDDGDDEAARCLEIALKRAPQLRSYDNETAKRRLSGFLMRRGYSGQVVSAAVKQALEGGGSTGSSRLGPKAPRSGAGPRFR